MSRGQSIPPVLIWGRGGGDGGNKCLWEGLPTPADHTGRPGNFLGLFFVHGKSLSNAVLPVFLIWLKEGSTGKTHERSCYLAVLSKHL